MNNIYSNITAIIGTKSHNVCGMALNHSVAFKARSRARSSRSPRSPLPTPSKPLHMPIRKFWLHIPIFQFSSLSFFLSTILSTFQSFSNILIISHLHLFKKLSSILSSPTPLSIYKQQHTYIHTYITSFLLLNFSFLRVGMDANE